VVLKVRGVGREGLGMTRAEAEGAGKVQGRCTAVVSEESGRRWSRRSFHEAISKAWWSANLLT